MRESLPVLIVVVPFLTGLLCGILGGIKRFFCFPLAMLCLLSSTICSFLGILETFGGKEIVYNLGGWSETLGIVFILNSFNAPFLFLISLVALFVVLFSKKYILTKYENQIYAFYALLLFFITGNLGIVITGDAFNLYVFLEILSLSSYALVALGRGEAYMASLRYLMMGTVGASFYLLGIGVLYLKTGSLNMGVIKSTIPAMMTSPSISLSFFLIVIGVCIKMAFFPFHSWLPFAYSNAIEPVSSFMAPIFTKVSVFILLKVIFMIFGLEFLQNLEIAKILFPTLAGIGMIYFAIKAYSQNKIKMSLCYILLLEVSMMFGGIWLGNDDGFIATFYHILADVLMTFILFSIIGFLKDYLNISKIDDLKNISFISMPCIFACLIFVIASVLGLPPFAGFFSKFYFLKSSFMSHQYFYAISIIVSNFILLSYFVKLLENSFFNFSSDKRDTTLVCEVRKENKMTYVFIGFSVSIATILLLVMGLMTQDVVKNLIMPFIK